MKLNLYKCSTKDREWYSLAKEICKGAIPLSCDGRTFGIPYEVPPEKIELVKEVEVDPSQFLDEEIKHRIDSVKSLLEDMIEADRVKHLFWRLWFK